MSAHPLPRMTPEQYLAMERVNPHSKRWSASCAKRPRGPSEKWKKRTRVDFSRTALRPPIKLTHYPPFYWTNYEPSADGRRFLIPVAVEQEAALPMTVVMNWMAGLKK